MSENETAAIGNGTVAMVKAKVQQLAFGVKGMVLTTIDEVYRFAKAVSLTRIKGAETPEVVLMKIQYGAELGMPLMASVVNVYVVDGRPALGATAIAARIRSAAGGIYNFRIKRAPPVNGEKIGKQMMSDAGVVVEMLVRIGTNDLKARNVYDDDEWAVQMESSFTSEDAKRAGLTGKDNHAKYPRDMMFHRALTRGARESCPEVFFGAVYTPEELGARVDDYGDVLDGNTGAPVQPPPPQRKSNAASAGAAIAKDLNLPPVEKPKAAPEVKDAVVEKPAEKPPIVEQKSIEQLDAEMAAREAEQKNAPDAQRDLTENAPSPGDMDDVQSAPVGPEKPAPRSDILLALRAIPVVTAETKPAEFLKKLTDLVALWSGRLSGEENAILRIYGRAKYNETRKTKPDAGMKDEERRSYLAGVEILAKGGAE